MWHVHRIVRIGFAFLATLAFGTASPAETSQEGAMVDAGRDFYVRYCASCHGKEARGDGPLANYLKQSPPDLTKIAARREGAFPSAEIAQIVRGERSVGAHGSADMPVWGRRFSQVTGGTMPGSEAAERARVQFLVEYLRSVQR